MKGKKFCPSCKKSCGPRTIECSCGHQFLERKNKVLDVKTKSGERGKKVCPHCEAVKAARSRFCECGYNFMTKTLESINGQPVEAKTFTADGFDWKELNSGEEIEVLGGGDYYIDKNNMRQYLTHRGFYKVISRTNNGIMAYGPEGFSFLGMEYGKSKFFECIVKTPHFIRKQNVKIRKR
jgi:hypothetical protein